MVHTGGTAAARANEAVVVRVSGEASGRQIRSLIAHTDLTGTAMVTACASGGRANNTGYDHVSIRDPLRRWPKILEQGQRRSGETSVAIDLKGGLKQSTELLSE